MSLASAPASGESSLGRQLEDALLRLLRPGLRRFWLGYGWPLGLIFLFEAFCWVYRYDSQPFRVASLGLTGWLNISPAQVILLYEISALLKNLAALGVFVFIIQRVSAVAKQLLHDTAAPGLERSALLRFKCTLRLALPLLLAFFLQYCLIYAYLLQGGIAPGQLPWPVALVQLLTASIAAAFPYLFAAALYVLSPRLGLSVLLLCVLGALKADYSQPLVGAGLAQNSLDLVRLLEGQYMYAYSAAFFILLLLVWALAARWRWLASTLAALVVGSQIICLLSGDFQLLPLPPSLVAVSQPRWLYNPAAYALLGTALQFNGVLRFNVLQRTYVPTHVDGPQPVAVVAVGPVPFLSFDHPSQQLLTWLSYLLLPYAALIYWLLTLLLRYGGALAERQARRKIPA